MQQGKGVASIRHAALVCDVEQDSEVEVLAHKGPHR